MRDFQTKQRDVPPACFLILALPVLLFILSNWLVPSIGVPLLDIGPDELLIDGHEYLEAVGRNRFLGAILFFGVVVIVAVAGFIAELFGPLTWRARILAIAVLIASQLPVIFSAAAHQEDKVSNWRSYHQMGGGVMEAVLSRGEVRMCQDLITQGTGETRVEKYVNNPDKTLFLGKPCTDNPGFQLFRSLLEFVNVLSGVGVASLVLGMILSLSCPSKDTPLEQRAFDHGRKQRASRRFLYLAGLMLSAGMFLTMSWMHWPIPFVDTSAHPGYAEVVNATLFYYGVFYTLLILTGFGPVMYLAARRSDLLALEHMRREESGEMPLQDELDKTPPTVTRLDKWKTIHGLRISVAEAIQALIATASPLLTAFAGSFAPI